MSETVELKACPFCGGEAKRITLGADDGPDNEGGDVITCTRCQASSHVEFGYKENLVSAWNTRTPAQEGHDELVGELERLIQEGRDEDGLTGMRLADQALARFCREHEHAILTALKTPGYEDAREQAARIAERFPIRADFSKHDTMNGIATAIRQMEPR